MFPLGHLGLTLAAAEAARRRAPLAALAIGALLPDLVDKPLGHLLLEWGTGRLWGHTLLLAAALATTAAAASRLHRPRAARLLAALAAGSAAHLLLDRAWETPQVLLWPTLGPMPRGDFRVERWLEILRTDRYVQAGEIAGLAALAWVTRRETRRRREKRREADR